MPTTKPLLLKESLEVMVAARLALKTLRSQNLITSREFDTLSHDLWLVYNKAQTLISLKETVE